MTYVSNRRGLLDLHLGGAVDLWVAGVQDLHGKAHQKPGPEGDAFTQTLVQLLVLVHQGVVPSGAIHVHPRGAKGGQEACSRSDMHVRKGMCEEEEGTSLPQDTNAVVGWPHSGSAYGDAGLNTHACGHGNAQCMVAIVRVTQCESQEKRTPPLVPFLEPSLVSHWSCLRMLVCSCVCEQGNLSDIHPFMAMNFLFLGVFSFKW